MDGFTNTTILDFVQNSKCILGLFGKILLELR